MQVSRPAVDTPASRQYAAAVGLFQIQCRSKCRHSSCSAVAPVRSRLQRQQLQQQRVAVRLARLASAADDSAAATVDDASPGTAGNASTVQDTCVLVECDGVLTDVHLNGHMPAFNRAFSELGYDCATWTPAIYHDLLRAADGTGEGMLKAYFDMVGWPQFLPTSERQLFCGKVYALKTKHLADIIQEGGLRVRPGAADFLQAALSSGARVGLISGTISQPSAGTCDAVLQALGPTLAAMLVTFSAADSSAGSSSDGGDEEGVAPEEQGRLTMEQALAKAQAEVKARGAADAAAATGAGVSPHLLAAQAGGAPTLVSPSFVLALCMALGAPASRCAVLAASSALLQAANAAGAYTVAVPPNLSARGSFPAEATVDGGVAEDCGGAGQTLCKWVGGSL